MWRSVRNPAGSWPARCGGNNRPSGHSSRRQVSASGGSGGMGCQAQQVCLPVLPAGTTRDADFRPHAGFSKGAQAVAGPVGIGPQRLAWQAGGPERELLRLKDQGAREAPGALHASRGEACRQRPATSWRDAAAGHQSRHSAACLAQRIWRLSRAAERRLIRQTAVGPGHGGDGGARPVECARELQRLSGPRPTSRAARVKRRR